MIGKARSIILEFILTILYIIFIACIPSLLIQSESIGLYVPSYFESVWITIYNLSQFTDVAYIKESGRIYPLFPDMFTPYLYSMVILFSSLVLSLAITLLLSYGYILSPAKVKKRIKELLVFLESVPDVMIVVIAQVIIIWFFKQTGILLLDIVSVSEDRAYILPILCLSLLPVIQLFKFFLLQLEEETLKPYVEFAKGKGFSLTYILWIHIMRNAFIHLHYHSKTIFLFILSNLMVLEIIFNMKGFINLLKMNVNIPEVMVIGVFMIYIPFFIFFQVTKLFVWKVSGGKGVEV